MLTMYSSLERARLSARDLYFLGASTIRQMKERGARRVAVCNSYPKSGTHLLSQVVQAAGGGGKWNDIVSVQSLSGVMNSIEHIRYKVGAAPNGSMVRAHLMYHQQVLDVLNANGARRIFIYRDLRDVAISHANWVTKEPRIFLHEIYQRMGSFEERLTASILGVPLGSPFGSNASQPNIGQDFSRWKGWLSDPDTLCVRFEDLVGARGGGDEGLRLKTVAAILKHLDLECGDDLGEPDALAPRFGSNVLNPNESHTFRKGNSGAIGGWRHRFTDEHKAQFKCVAGDLLIDLGYERDLSW